MVNNQLDWCLLNLSKVTSNYHSSIYVLWHKITANSLLTAMNLSGPGILLWSCNTLCPFWPESMQVAALKIRVWCQLSYSYGSTGTTCINDWFVGWWIDATCVSSSCSPLTLPSHTRYVTDSVRSDTSPLEAKPPKWIRDGRLGTSLDERWTPSYTWAGFPSS